MTTERKAEGGEAVAWLCVSTDGVQVDATARKTARDDYARFGRTITPLYTHPSPSAVEALARAAVLLRDEFAGLPHSLGYEFTHLPKIDAALSHPEIAALLKGEKK